MLGGEVYQILTRTQRRNFLGRQRPDLVLRDTVSKRVVWWALAHKRVTGEVKCCLTRGGAPCIVTSGVRGYTGPVRRLLLLLLTRSPVIAEAGCATTQDTGPGRTPTEA